MANAKLQVEGREIPLGHGITTIGRSPENAVAFPHDHNISRYHAEIEFRDGDFYLVELGSSNGTQINGATVRRDERLRDGDTITFGGTAHAEFLIVKEPKSIPNDTLATNSGEPEKAVAEESSDEKTSPWMRRTAVAACVLAAVCLATGGYYYYSRSTACDATASITAPENGDLVKNATEIEVRADSKPCVARAVFTLDEMIIADADAAPYEATIDPREFPELADGLNHSLKLSLEDKQGNIIGKPDVILLAFDTLATPTPTPVEETPSNVDKPRPTQQTGKTVSLIETQEMAKRLTQQFSGGFAYKFDKQFLQEVQKRAAEYANAASYFSRASQYRDTINVAFVQEQNLDAPLGFILAMSRSKFTPNKQNGAEGLWQMPNDFVNNNAYNGTCEVKDLSEPTQKCAAIAAAAYLKNIVLNVFEGDTVYGIAAFGMSPQEAAAWKASLPANRSDFWNVIRQPNQREEVVKFFAAGIVAENPQKFGLKTDQPISQLYRNLLG